MSLPVLFKINNKHLIQIMLSSSELSYYETKAGKSLITWTDEEVLKYSIEAGVYPTEVKITAEQYSENASRTASYELVDLTIVNCKSKPEFTWSLIKASYVVNLLNELNFKYNYKQDGKIEKELAEPIRVSYWDFNGLRTIDAYMGQTIDGTLIQYEDYTTNGQTDTIHKGPTLYWNGFRIAFPER